MRKFVLTGAILLTFLTTLFAQETALKIDSDDSVKTGQIDVFDRFSATTECETGGRFDNFLVAVRNNPEMTGYVIFYQSTDVLPSRYDTGSHQEIAFRNHLKFRRFDASRLTIINGGFREEVFTEMWLLPNGSPPPTPTDTVAPPQIPIDIIFLYDRDYLSNSYENDFAEEFILTSVQIVKASEQLAVELENYSPDEETTGETEVETVEPEIESEKQTPEEIENERFFWANEKFGKLIKSRKDFSGVLIFYADDAFYDINKLRIHIEAGKRRIAESANLPKEKIKVIFGGYRNAIETELWIVPKNGEPPPATPEEREKTDPENETENETAIVQ